MKFLDDMYGPDVLRTLKKIERKRHDVRRRLINEQVGMIRSFLRFFSFERERDEEDTSFFIDVIIQLRKKRLNTFY